MEKSRSRRNQTPGSIRPQSPNLQMRTETRISNVSAPLDIPPLKPNSIRNSPNIIIKTTPRSKSTTSSRSVITKSNENRFGFSQRYDHGRNSPSSSVAAAAAKAIEMAKSKRAKSVCNSPSAWALSPGRSPSPAHHHHPLLMSPNPAAAELPLGLKNGGSMKVLLKQASGGGGGGVGSGVLKFFRSHKKVSPIQEEAFHRYRVLHTRLLQWRFVNARAQTTINTRNTVAEAKLFNVWLRIYQLRNSMVEKRIQLRKLKQEMRLLRVVNPQIHLLNEWTKIEKRNLEALAKLTRNLSVLSVRVPLIKGAKVDMVSLYKSMRTAMNVMNKIEATLSTSFIEIEETMFLLKELTETIRQEREGLEELRKTVAIVSSLEAQEKSLRVYLIQAAKEGIVVN